MHLMKPRAVQKKNGSAVSIRWLPILLLALATHGANAATNDVRVILVEDFESYTNTTTLKTVWRDGTSELDFQAPGGGKAALHDGGDLNTRGGFSVQADAGHEIVFSADIYDPATNAEKRVTVALRNSSGANLEFGHIYETGPYAMRIAGFAEPTDWIPFDTELKPQAGWNRFQAVITLTNTIVTVDLGADGKIDKILTFAGTAPGKPFTGIRFGGLPGRKSHGGPVLVDNIKLALVPTGQTLPPTATTQPTTTGNPTKMPTLKPTPAPPTTPPTAMPTAMPMTANPIEPARANEIGRANAAGRAAEETGRAEEAGGGNAVMWWIVGALAIIIGMLGAMLKVLRRGSAREGMAVATLGGGVRAELAGGLPSELAEYAKQRLVQGLYTQRNTLLEAQKQAQEEIMELEARLTALQLPLHDRINAYENRIAELEKQLQTRGEEMRELTQATLLLVREKLEKEKERERGGDRNRFN